MLARVTLILGVAIGITMAIARPVLAGIPAAPPATTAETGRTAGHPTGATAAPAAKLAPKAGTTAPAMATNAMATKMTGGKPELKVPAEKPPLVVQHAALRARRHALRRAPAEAVLKETAPAAQAEKGRRDPFLSIISTSAAEPHSCTTGKGCLDIPHLVVRGVARHAGSMVALVESAQHRSYFLRVNDAVFNGEVVSITNDSVIFREKTIDRAGRAHTRDIVKRIGTMPAA